MNKSQKGDNSMREKMEKLKALRKKLKKAISSLETELLLAHLGIKSCR